MRIDMPGEEKFGLDFMDLHYERRGFRKSCNIRHGLMRTKFKSKMKAVKATKLRRLPKMREKMFRGTRIVLDPIGVLDNPTLYRQRGWLQWDKQSLAAKTSLLEKTALFEKMAANKLPTYNEFQNFREENKGKRVNRWPPSVSELQIQAAQLRNGTNYGPSIQICQHR
jgi:hypothetical protein